MGILQELYGWVLIFLAAVNGAIALGALAEASRNGRRFRALPWWVWSSLLLTLLFLDNGVLALRNLGRLDWTIAPLSIVWLLVVATPKLMARNKAKAPDPADTLTPQPPIALDAKTRDLIDRIEHARFGTTRFSPGYDEEAVDNLLDQLVAILRVNGLPDPAELRHPQFATTRLRPGYVIADVDAFLQEIAAATAPL